MKIHIFNDKRGIKLIYYICMFLPQYKKRNVYDMLVQLKDTSDGCHQYVKY